MIPCEKDFDLENFQIKLPKFNFKSLFCYQIKPEKITAELPKDAILTLFSPRSAKFYLDNLHLFEQVKIITFGPAATNILKSAKIKPNATAKTQTLIDMMRAIKISTLN